MTTQPKPPTLSVKTAGYLPERQGMEFETRILNEVLDDARSGDTANLAAASRKLAVVKQYYGMRTTISRTVLNEAKIIEQHVEQ